MSGVAPDDPEFERLQRLAEALLAAWKKEHEARRSPRRKDRRQLATQPVVALADWRRAAA